MIQNLFVWYFNVLEQFGLIGVATLMAFESSIFPVPSELVIPPAAVIYIKNGHQDGAIVLLIAVILAGTVGSLIGASITYWIARAVGRPFIIKYGKYFFFPEHKLHKAERWVARYGTVGVFMARLLPGARHFIGIPAGLADMRFRSYALMTIWGSLIWCTILAVFGLMMGDEMRQLIAHYKSNNLVEPESIKLAYRNLSYGVTGLLLLMTGAYYIYHKIGSDSNKKEDETKEK
jgi:membrane protein DedA with SNARE-associated domain